MGATGTKGEKADNKGTTQGNYVYKRTACISNNIIYLYSFCYTHISELFPPAEKPFSILEPSSQNHLKLIDQLSDPPVPLIYCISPASPPTTSSKPGKSTLPPSEPANRCFTCIRIHSFPECVPTFCKKAKHGQPTPKK